jgi:lysozyme family protein
MSASLYKQSLSLVLAHEGGFVNHPKDPGGPTNKGVTQRVYDAYRKLKGLPVRSVKLIEPIETEEIYRKQYWRMVKGDDLPAGLDYAVFDFAVNSGISRAVKYLQTLVGVWADGAIGLQTMSAILEAAKADEETLIIKYCANRMAFLKSLSTFPTFGKGWTRRVIGDQAGVQSTDTGVIDIAVSMARGDDAYLVPNSIGTLPGEVPAKAISAEEYYPVATPNEIAAIVAMNDSLAARIALSSL